MLTYKARDMRPGEVTERRYLSGESLRGLEAAVLAHLRASGELGPDCILAGVEVEVWSDVAVQLVRLPEQPAEATPPEVTP